MQMNNNCFSLSPYSASETLSEEELATRLLEVLAAGLPGRDPPGYFWKISMAAQRAASLAAPGLAAPLHFPPPCCAVGASRPIRKPQDLETDSAYLLQHPDLCAALDLDPARIGYAGVPLRRRTAPAGPPVFALAHARPALFSKCSNCWFWLAARRRWVCTNSRLYQSARQFDRLEKLNQIGLAATSSLEISLVYTTACCRIFVQALGVSGRRILV